MWTTHNQCSITTTKDIVYPGCGDDIDAGVLLGIRVEKIQNVCKFCFVASQLFWRHRLQLCLSCFPFSLFSLICYLCERYTLGNSTDSSTIIDTFGLIAAIIISFISVNRIRCQIATGIQLLDDDRFAAAFLNIHGDGSGDSTTGIVSTEHALKGRAISNGKDHIAVNICVLRTTKQLLHTFSTIRPRINRTIDRCIFSTAVAFVHKQSTVIHAFDHRHSSGTDVSFLITTAINVMDCTTLNRCRGDTGTVTIVSFSCFWG